jgi:SAM-dependent methyltransferase
MPGEDGAFWDGRYSREGPIWGWDPSPTAREAVPYLRPGLHVLDVGFGYGRDLAFLMRHGCRASGIDLSTEGRRLALELLEKQGLSPERLWTGRFEEVDLPAGHYDAVCCHRVLHLLQTPEAAARFARRVAEVLRPGGLLCVAARNFRDLEPAAMVRVGEDVYEYRDRPGHQIRYWDRQAFDEVFGATFRFLILADQIENESRQRSVPCHLTVLVGTKNGNGVPAHRALEGVPSGVAQS